MGIRTQLDYEFINLDNLDENVASKIRMILKTDIPPDVLKLPWANGDEDFNSNSVVPEMQPEVQNDWQHYDETIPTYEMTTPPGPHLTPPMGPCYPSGPLLQVPYQDWQLTPGYSTSSTDPTAYTYVSSVPYPSPLYPPSQDSLPPQSPIQDRRQARRPRKTETYNRQIPSNELQQSYLIQQPHQFSPLPPICHPGVQYLPYVSSQQHPAAGRPIFIPSHPTQYPQPPPHHPQGYAHQIPPTYQHQHSPTIKHQRNPQSYTYNHEKNGQLGKNDKKYDKITASQSFRQVNHNKINNVNNNDKVMGLRGNGLVNGDKLSDGRGGDEGKGVGVIGTDDAGEKMESAGEKVESAGEKVESAGEKVEPAGEKAEPAGEKAEPAGEKVEPAGEKVEPAGEKAEPAGESSGEGGDFNGSGEKGAEDGVKCDGGGEVDAGRAETAAPATRTFASILKNRGGNPPGFVKDPSFKLPPAIRANVPDVHIVEEERGEGRGVDGKRGSVDSGEVGTERVERGVLERKSLPVESVQTPLNHPVMYRMGEFLLNYQMDKQTVSLLPRGLTNRSNYCYINSILQALLACPPFYNLLRALPHSRHPPKNSSTPLIDNMVKFVNEFMPLPEGERQQRRDKGQKKNDDTFDIKGGNAFEPSYVYTMLKNTSSPGVFSIEGRQEDAEEFLSCLLNGISDEMLELMKQVSENSQNSKPTEELNTSYNSGDEEWKVMGPKNKGSITRCTEFGRTPLSDIFRGQLRSRISRQGDQSTDNVQPFFTLQLDIEKAESVKAALEILVGKDQVEGMTCSKTKQQIQAWKQVTLEELPVILILHLKWFDYKLDGCSKIFKNVAYGIDLKVDGKFLSLNAAKKLTAKQKQYKLFAVTYHDGKEATKGHYVTDAFHVGFNAWVRYDDSSIKGISEIDVLNPSPPRVPYLLYYRRCDTIGNHPNTSRTR